MKNVKLIKSCVYSQDNKLTHWRTYCLNFDFKYRNDALWEWAFYRVAPMYNVCLSQCPKMKVPWLSLSFPFRGKVQGTFPTFPVTFPTFPVTFLTFANTFPEFLLISLKFLSLVWFILHIKKYQFHLLDRCELIQRTTVTTFTTFVGSTDFRVLG